MKFLSWRTNEPMTYLDHDYTSIMKRVDIKSLEKSRFKNDLTFLYKLANGQINCPELINKLKFHQPVNPARSVKSVKLFEVDASKLQYSAIQKYCHIINLNKEWIEIKNITLYQFQSLLNKNQRKMFTNL